MGTWIILAAGCFALGVFAIAMAARQVRQLQRRAEAAEGKREPDKADVKIEAARADKAELREEVRREIAALDRAGLVARLRALLRGGPPPVP